MPGVSRSRPWGILPVKRLDWAKSRLDGALSPERRRTLAAALMQNALQALLKSRALERVVVVSADPEALSLARKHGAQVLAEKSVAGLNQALTDARTEASRQGAASLLVLASDLPLVTPSEVRTLVRELKGSGVTLAPDRRRQGTNALLLQPADAIEFAFGIDSFERHLQLAHNAGIKARVCDLPGLAFDIDLPGDLDDLCKLGWKPPEVLEPVTTQP
jgi:2-phospho-L-lactate/phosphoenolpyruvate guanylyltransferase